MTGIFDLFYTVLNEFFGAIAIMAVAVTMVNSQHLRRLCNGAVKRVVAALAFFLLNPLATLSALRQMPNIEPSKSQCDCDKLFTH